jgi:hypothetical protein
MPRPKANNRTRQRKTRAVVAPEDVVVDPVAPVSDGESSFVPPPPSRVATPPPPITIEPIEVLSPTPVRGKPVKKPRKKVTVESESNDSPSNPSQPSEEQQQQEPPTETLEEYERRQQAAGSSNRALMLLGVGGIIGAIAYLVYRTLFGKVPDDNEEPEPVQEVSKPEDQDEGGATVEEA